MQHDMKHTSHLRNRLEKDCQIEESYVNSSRGHRLPHVTNISFKYVGGEGPDDGELKT